MQSRVYVWCLMMCQSSSAGSPDGFQRQEIYIDWLIDCVKVVCHDCRPSIDRHSEIIIIAIMTEFSPCGLPASLQVSSAFVCTGLYSCRVMALPSDVSIDPLVTNITTKLVSLVGLHGRRAGA